MVKGEAVQTTPEAADDWPYEWNENGLADALVDAHKDDLLWQPSKQKDGTWYAWLGEGFWRPRPIQKLQDLVREQHRRAVKVAQTLDEKYKPAVLKILQQYTKAPNKINVLRSAIPRLPGENVKFDQHPHLINWRNCTVDLFTGKTYDPDPHDYLTQQAQAEYHKVNEAKFFASLWYRTLDAILPEVEMQDYLWRLMGYVLNGALDEQLFVIFQGTGGNGKSVIMDVMLGLLGFATQNTTPRGYATKISMGAITVNIKDPKAGDTPTPSIMTMKKARLISASEAEHNVHLAMATLKHLTGDKVTAGRGMGKELELFQRTGTIIISVNPMPIIHGNDRAALRRIHLVPFDQNFTGERENTNLVREILDTERDIVAAWLVSGAREVVKRPLKKDTPQKILNAVQEYALDMDPLQQWLDEQYQDYPGNVGWLTDMFNSFNDFLREQNERPWTLKTFAKNLRDKGYVIQRSSRGQRRVQKQWNSDATVDAVTRSPHTPS